jgi:hypothetical protein
MEQHKLQANRICCLRVFGLYPQIVLNRTWHEFATYTCEYSAQLVDEIPDDSQLVPTSRRPGAQTCPLRLPSQLVGEFPN